MCPTDNRVARSFWAPIKSAVQTPVDPNPTTSETLRPRNRGNRNCVCVVFFRFGKKREKQNMWRNVLAVWLIVAASRLGLTAARSGIYSEESPQSSSIRQEQCHDGCIKKVGHLASCASHTRTRNPGHARARAGRPTVFLLCVWQRRMAEQV